MLLAVGTYRPDARPVPAGGQVALADLRGSGDWDVALCIGCGAMLVAWAGSPLGLMMLGPAGARFGAACALQCLIALE